jgi:hypothetical protein
MNNGKFLNTIVESTLTKKISVEFGGQLYHFNGTFYKSDSVSKVYGYELRFFDQPESEESIYHFEFDEEVEFDYARKNCRDVALEIIKGKHAYELKRLENWNSGKGIK